MQQQSSTETVPTPARDWLKKLQPYRVPSHLRSVIEILLTGTLFVATWIAAWWALDISYWLTLAISVLAGGFLVRLFLIQHDCGHGAFFKNKAANNWVGRIMGIFTLTPYEVWKRAHALHHASSGNLDKRGVGDISTLTVDEYFALSPMKRLSYRLYRHPIVMFGIGPAYVYFLRNRLPLGFMNSTRQWGSAMGTNLASLIVAGVVIYFTGFVPFLLVFVPTTFFAAALGIWMFYVQHQFEDTVWATSDEWDLHDAALYGSSYYKLPAVLQWFTANIGIHHVHHLYGKIPYYYLPRVLRDFPELAEIRRLDLIESFSTVKLRLWDEAQKKMITFKAAYAKQAA